jgi:RHS repeat-associated protein
LIDRLKHMERGRLTAGKDGVTDKTFAQCWSLDETGNWKKFLEDSDGDGTWDLNQFRSANRVNEITDISELAGPAWATPVYNRAGNMTTIPKPADPTQSFTGTYDAWNRLVKLEDGSGTVAQYEYDGAKRRTVKKTYASGTLSETRHFYYIEPSRWQVVEEHVESSSDAERQFVWGLRYVDDIVLRDRDTDADGTLDERLYGLQDANWNVTGIADASGAVLERYAYSAYGKNAALTAAFAIRGHSIHDWETRYAGYHRDSDSSFFWIRNRIYCDSTSTWLSRDPIGYAEALNLFEYVYSNPISQTDPFGLIGLKTSIAISCIAGAVAGIARLWHKSNPIAFDSQVRCNALDIACRASVATMLSSIMGCLIGISPIALKEVILLISTEYAFFAAVAQATLSTALSLMAMFWEELPGIINDLADIMCQCVLISPSISYMTTNTDIPPKCRGLSVRNVPVPLPVFPGWPLPVQWGIGDWQVIPK